MTLCDLSSLYSPTGGGIRTYYNARLAWFSRQRHHRYVLIVPSRRNAVVRASHAATVIEVRGPRVTRDPSGYRLLLDVPAVTRIVRELRPDVLETGDPWISGPIGLSCRRHVRGVVSSFYHSDVMGTYLQPWADRGDATRPVRAVMARTAQRALVALQVAYDLTLVGSAGLAERLRRSGVQRVHVLSLGVDAGLYRSDGRSRAQARIRRLLFAGRLDADKDVDVLLQILPALLRRTDVEVTVAGKGSRQTVLEHLRHPRFRYVGFVADRSSLRALLTTHHVLLAPGRYETFGLAALEASAAGMIVVGPDTGGTAELLMQLQRPFIFEAGNADSFLATIERALDSDFDAGSADSRALARRYGTWDAVVSQGVELYARTLDAERR